MLIADLRARGHEPSPILEKSEDRELSYAILRSKEYCLDPGGMLHTQEPWMDFNIHGLTVSVRSSTVNDYARVITKYRVRYFGDVPYFKIHSAYSCLVLTPRQMAKFSQDLNDAIIEADRQSMEFWYGKKTMNQVLQEANGRSDQDFAHEHPGDRFTKEHV